MREARRLRGTVMLAVEGHDKQWCAVCGAVDVEQEKPERTFKRPQTDAGAAAAAGELAEPASPLYVSFLPFEGFS